MQEAACWRSAAYEQLDQQQQADADEAVQRYMLNVQLLKQICQGTASATMQAPHTGMDCIALTLSI